MSKERVKVFEDLEVEWEEEETVEEMMKRKEIEENNKNFENWAYGMIRNQHKRIMELCSDLYDYKRKFEEANRVKEHYKRMAMIERELRREAENIAGIGNIVSLGGNDNE